MASLNPYLNFAGNCAEAFDFYRSVFGGEFDGLMKFSDAPPDPAAPLDPALADLVMHVSLPLGDSVLMGSDVPAEMGTVTPGNTAYVCVSQDSVDEGARVFNGLTAGGDVEMPFGKQFWGDYFGSGTDKFGIKWMVDVADPEAGTGG
ncbi:VOC family protein [Nocardioides limicola]|uniref:VOC family protein n=1 Tax=Nocardioides limicola TaxID=2803368 RepID=UPI00193BAB95|nr:VOC family protein [Nocardioides sp. DJM-14]